MTASDGIRWENAYSVIDPQINAEGVHLWPFDPGLPVEVRFFLFDRRRGIRLNRHDYFELLYFHSGEAVCQIQDRYFPVRAGDLAVISSTHYHTLHKGPRPADVEGAALYFLPEVLRAADRSGDDIEYLMPFLLQDAAFPHVVPGEAGLAREIEELLRRIHAELPAASALARLSVKTYLKMLLVLLVRHYASYRGTAESFNRRQRAIEQLRPVFELLERRYAEPLTVREAAAAGRMSPSHFMRFFRQVTGQSFITYLNNFRVAKAQELLLATDRPLAEISQAVGFCDQSYFSSIFRRLVHLTPRQYKHQFGRPASRA